MSEIKHTPILTDNWQELSFAMLRSKELSPAAKGVLHVWLKMKPEMAAQEAHTLHALMHARLLSTLGKKDDE